MANSYNLPQLTPDQASELVHLVSIGQLVVGEYKRSGQIPYPSGVTTTLAGHFTALRGTDLGPVVAELMAYAKARK